MKFPKIEVAYTIVFNNTGIDWTELQKAICNIIEEKYSVLHCIGNKYHEELDVGVNHIVINNIPCNLYFKVNDLQIEVIAVKANIKDNDWKYETPITSKRQLYLVTVNRFSDNLVWVQDMIWDNFADRWYWAEGEENEKVDETKFKIIAWKPMPNPAEIK